MQKNNTTSHIYVGSTSLDEDSFYDMFEFQYELDDELSASSFTLIMGIEYFDEDDLMIEYKKKYSLSSFIKYLSDTMKWNIPESIIKLHENIDFIVAIDTTNSYNIDPEKLTFKNKFISIDYLGEFEKEWVS